MTDGIVEAKKGGVTARRTIYQKISKHTDEIISTLYHLMMGATQESVRIAAAKELLSRLAPVLKQVEHTGIIGHQRVLSDKEYEATLLASGIDPKTGRKIGVKPTKKNKGSKV